MPRRTFYRGAADGDVGGGVDVDFHAIQVEVDFGHADGGEETVAVTPIEADWVTDDHLLVVTPAGVSTDDHDPHDAAVERIMAYVANVQPGVGFDVVASAPSGSWGKYALNIIGW